MQQIKASVRQHNARVSHLRDIILSVITISAFIALIVLTAATTGDICRAAPVNIADTIKLFGC